MNQGERATLLAWNKVR
jgi:hypothetical protein